MKKLCIPNFIDDISAATITKILYKNRNLVSWIKFSWMGIKSLFLISCLFFTSSAWAQEADNSKKLPKECELKLRLKGTSKHDAADHDFAMQYQGVELIWLHFDKSEKGEGLPAAKRVFLVSEKMENDGIVEYLIYKKDFEEGMNAPIFPDWKSNANKFYLASCFDAWVAP